MELRENNGETVPARSGKIFNLRWFKFLLISVLVAGQIHLCQATYTLPDGRQCFECLTLDHNSLSESSLADQALTAQHGDCHDCCELQSCDDLGKSIQRATVASSFEFVATLNPLSDLRLAQPGTMTLISIHVESAPSTGPPSKKSSRAPPSFTNPFPSAGRRIVNLA